LKERLSIKLSVTLGGTSHTIPGGNVRALKLVMTSYGVEGEVSFLVQDDEVRGGKYADKILADFQKPDLAEVEIAVQPSFWDTSLAKTVPAIASRGLVLEKSVTERAYERVFGEPAVLFRVYTLRFVDPARALWAQHFPCNLLTQKAFKDALEAYKGANITASYDWDTITAERPLIFFHLDPARGASFYDLVLWFVRKNNGVVTFDHAAGTYAFTGAKAADGEAAVLARTEVEAVVSVFPALPRWQPRVLNAYAESPKTEVVENAAAAAGITRDVLLRASIEKDVEDRVSLEKARPLAPGRELEITFRTLPTVAVAPGSLLDVSTKGGFSRDSIAASEPFRVYRLELSAQSSEEDAERDYGDAATEFEASLVARLEQKSEKTVRLPAFLEPHFPGFLEGKVVSEVGEESDITYQIYQDESTSADQYKVQVPLFADQIIAVPFDPYQGSGTFYLPAYKGARVLLELEFDRAHIARLLDWRAGARVPMDGQGEHLFLGKSDTSNTSILHDYEDKKPVLQIKRTNDKDTAILRIEEGRLTLQVKESEG
jgi:hypothetical protein